MRLLVVTAAFPNPPTDGLRIPVFHLLRLLAPRHRIHLVAFHPPDGPPSADDLGLLQDWGVQVTLLPARRLRLRDEFFANVSPLPHSFFPYRTREAFATVRRLALEADLVHAMSFNMGQFRRVCRDKPGVFSPYDAISVLLERQRQQPSRGAWYRMYYQSQVPKVRRFEEDALSAWDAVHFVTDVDAQAVARRAARGNVRVIPNGVDTASFEPPDPRPTTVVPELAFTGAMFGPQNVDAVVWFHKEVLPLVRTRYPEARFVIAGRDPAAEVRALADADRETVVTGTVSDLRGYLWRAAVFLCTLRTGVGIKNRLLEAMAAGCPIVSTSIGVEGMDVRDGEHLLVVDTPQRIADAVIRLLDDRALAARLGAAARQRAIARYGWESVVERVEALYSEALRLHSSTR